MSEVEFLLKVNKIFAQIEYPKTKLSEPKLVLDDLDRIY